MRYGLPAKAIGTLVLAILVSGATHAPSPVADAAMRGDLDAVRTLIARGNDVNAAQGDGMTALHWAASNGDAKIAALLLQARARVDVVTRIDAHTPLHIASRVGSAAVVKLLLDAGADASVRTGTGVAPIHFAALAGSGEVIAALLDRGADVNAREPAWEQTPLMLAAAGNRADAVRVLLQRGADPALQARIVDLMVLAAEDQEARAQRNRVLAGFRDQAESPQLWRPDPAQVRAAVQAARAVELKEAGAIAVTEEEYTGGGGAGGGDEDVAGFTGLVGKQGGLTALLLAAREGHIEVGRALLEGGAAVNERSPADGTTPLLLAVMNGHYDLAMFFLAQGADPGLTSQAGATPLYAAINKEWAPSSRTPQPTYNLQQRSTYLELMQALLKAGADVNVRLQKSLWYTTYNRDNLRVDFRGATAFWRAAYATDVAAMRLLLAHGADPGIPTMRPPPRAGRRGGLPAEAPRGAPGGRAGVAAGAGAPEGRADPSGLPPVPEGGPGILPIHAATGTGYGQGYAANDHRHVPGAWMEALKFLVEELGADVNARDFSGYTALHNAAARGDNEMIEYLVSKGADVTAVARTGQTTADMANGPVQRISPFLDTVALLEKLGSKNSNRCMSC